MPQLLLLTHHCQVSSLVRRVAPVSSANPNTSRPFESSSRLLVPPGISIGRLVEQQLRVVPRKRTSATTTGFPVNQRQPSRVLCHSMGQGSSSAGTKEDISSRKADQIVQALKEKGVKCVAFDMDQTVVSRHSRGNLRRSKFEWFKGHVTEAFVELVPRLSSAGHIQPAATSPRCRCLPIRNPSLPPEPALYLP